MKAADAPAKICYRPRPPTTKMSYPPSSGEIDGEAVRERAMEPAGRPPAQKLTYENSKTNSKAALRTVSPPGASRLAAGSRPRRPPAPPTAFSASHDVMSVFLCCRIVFIIAFNDCKIAQSLCYCQITRFLVLFYFSLCLF